MRCVNSQAHKCKLQNGQMNAAGRALALRQCLFSRSHLHAAKSRSTYGLQQRPQLCRAASSSGGGGDGGGKQELAPPDVRELARMAHIGVTDEEVRIYPPLRLLPSMGRSGDCVCSLRQLVFCVPGCHD
jgi:hypothetical protein